MKKAQLMPLLLTPSIILLDQLTKLAVTRSMRLGQVIEVWGDFVWLWYVRNTAMAFSIGGTLPADVRATIFMALPLLVLGAILFFYFRSRDLSAFQRWCFAGILGGGLGNLVDRFFRGDGVVDFVSVKIYGLFGLERWPVFNLADASIVVAGLALLASYVREEFRSRG